MVSVAALLARGMLWAQSSPYEVGFQCVGAGGAALMMIQSLRLKRYAFAAAFGAVLLAYNPVAVVFPFPADLQQSLVLICAIPFAASAGLCAEAPGRPGESPACQQAEISTVTGQERFMNEYDEY
jgi:hypothetical protein